MLLLTDHSSGSRWMFFTRSNPNSYSLTPNPFAYVGLQSRFVQLF